MRSRAQAKVLVVGGGGIGAPVVWSLAAAGVGELVIVDDDRIELSNLHRQILFGESDVGAMKIEAIKSAVSKINPRVKLTCIEDRLLPNNAFDLVRSVDLIVDGCDNFATRFLAADACAIAQKPVVHAASVRWVGTCFVAGPNGRGPCYRCLFEDLPEGPAPDCASAGIVGPVCGVIGSIAADAAISVLDGFTDRLGTIVSLDGWQRKLRQTQVAQRPDCPLCGANPTIHDLNIERYVAQSCSSW